MSTRIPARINNQAPDLQTSDALEDKLKGWVQPATVRLFPDLALMQMSGRDTNIQEELNSFDFDDSPGQRRKSLYLNWLHVHPLRPHQSLIERADVNFLLSPEALMICNCSTTISSALYQYLQSA